ncbi:BNR repeat-containing protein [Streptomyces sp. NPDC004752]
MTENLMNPVLKRSRRPFGVCSSALLILGGVLIAIPTPTAYADGQQPLPPLTCTPMSGPSYDLGGPGKIKQVSTVGDTWAGHPVTQSLLTSGKVQYVAYYDEDRRMTVGKRTLPRGDWHYKKLDSKLGWDSHNYVTLAVDAKGNLHVSGNMHVVPMEFYSTTNPGDISTLRRVPTLVDSSLEQKVTYPSFIKGPNGELIFSFRNGSSGRGDTIFYKLDSSTGKWSKLLDTPLFAGGDTASAYYEGPQLGPDGYFHIAYVWRMGSTDASTNSRLSYMKSKDLVHWETSNGRPLQLPLTHGNGEVVDDIPTSGGVLNNQTKLGFDNQGRVTITYYKYAADGSTQMFVTRPDGKGGWTSTQVSKWAGRFDIGGSGTLAVPITVKGVVPLGDNALRLDYTCNDDHKSMILDDSLNPIAEVPTPRYPAGFLTPESDFPGIQVFASADLAGPQKKGKYVLRWEAMPSNNDQPRPEWPTAGKLRVYYIKADSR